MILVVLTPFDDYRRGDRITEREAIARVLAGARARCVLRVFIAR